MPQKRGEKCGVCCKAVSDSDIGLECEICEQWFRSKCQDVTDYLYKMISQHSNSVHWFC